MISHNERAHAVLSASSAHRWLSCTPSALLEQQFPDTTSNAAKEGTLAHELAELKLRNYFYTPEFGKRKLSSAVKKLKTDPLWQEEMAGYTDDYLDYVKQIALGFQGTPYVAIEKRVNLDGYIPDGFGTADCILIGDGAIHVIDFKYGKGVPVSAEHNPQMMLYALGAYEAYRMLYPVETVKMSIVQPRLTDGNSDWECTLEELLKFGDDVRTRAALAAKGEGEYAPSEKACRFCRARAQCRARAAENVKLAFQIGKLPPLITREETGQYLKQGQDVARWLGDLQDWALAECLAGREVPGWKAVEGRGSREWTDADEAFSRLISAGTDEAVLYERKPLTLAQTEKLVGKKDFESCVGELVVKKPGKPCLVEETDKRPGVTNVRSAAEAFG